MTAVELYQSQVDQLHSEVVNAAIATNGGAGAANGKRYKGLFYHQWVGRYKAALESLENTKRGANPIAAMLEVVTNG